MRIFLTIVTITLFTSFAAAQNAKTIGSELGDFERIVRGAPFSAEASLDSVQLLSDGTKLSRSSNRKLFRDNDGRLRREEGPTQLGIPGSNVFLPESMKIIDPVSGLKFELNLKARNFKQVDFKLSQESKMELKKENEWETKEQQLQRQEKERARQRFEEERQTREKEKQADKNLSQPGIGASHSAAGSATASANSSNEPAVSQKPNAPATPNPKKPATTVVSLGSRIIEGVKAEGTRTTTTIPAGMIGNDRDMNVVYEKWYSPELQMIVLSTNIDPRIGEQTYRLKNISRENPPMSLFTPPDDFRKVGTSKPKQDKPPKAPKPVKPQNVDKTDESKSVNKSGN